MRKTIFTLLSVLFVCNIHAQSLVYDENAQVRKVGNFHGISVGSGITVYISQGKEQAVAVSAEDSKYVDKITTEVQNGILKIRTDSKLWNNFNWGNKKLKAYVTVTDIDYLSLSGGSIGKIVESLSFNKMNGDLSGGSILEGTLKGAIFNCDFSGGSIAKLDGDIDRVSFDCSGGSIVKDYTLNTNYCNVGCSGGSIVNISVSKELKADASGGSIINYKGDGVISSVQASGGSIIKKKD